MKKYYRLVYKNGTHSAWASEKFYNWLACKAEKLGATLEEKIEKVVDNS